MIALERQDDEINEHEAEGSSEVGEVCFFCVMPLEREDRKKAGKHAKIQDRDW